MLWFSAWNADRVTNWNLYFRAPSSFWNAATWASVRCLRQLNEGEQLYASILPGYFAWIAAAIHAKYPGKMLAYNCSPSFNWRKHLSEAQVASFQKELGALSYKFQFVTLSAFHALNHSMFELARAYRDKGMAAYSELQNREFASEKDGYAAVRHQEFVGVGYFDEITQIEIAHAHELLVRSEEHTSELQSLAYLVC